MGQFKYTKGQIRRKSNLRVRFCTMLYTWMFPVFRIEDKEWNSRNLSNNHDS